MRFSRKEVAISIAEFGHHIILFNKRIRGCCRSASYPSRGSYDFEYYVTSNYNVSNKLNSMPHTLLSHFFDNLLLNPYFIVPGSYCLATKRELYVLVKKKQQDMLQT